MEIEKEKPLSSYSLVRVYAVLGEMEKTMEYLQKAAEERNDHLIFMDYYRKSQIPFLNESRITEFITKTGIPRADTNSS